MNTPTPTELALEVLNSALRTDPKAIERLMEYRTPCNEALANHPDVTTTESRVWWRKADVVGPLGLINGILHRQTGSLICAVWDTDNDKKPVLTGFRLFRSKETPDKLPELFREYYDNREQIKQTYAIICARLGVPQEFVAAELREGKLTIEIDCQAMRKAETGTV